MCSHVNLQVRMLKTTQTTYRALLISIFSFRCWYSMYPIEVPEHLLSGLVDHWLIFTVKTLKPLCDFKIIRRLCGSYFFPKLFLFLFDLGLPKLADTLFCMISQILFICKYFLASFAIYFFFSHLKSKVECL